MTGINAVSTLRSRSPSPTAEETSPPRVAPPRAAPPGAPTQPGPPVELEATRDLTAVNRAMVQSSLRAMADPPTRCGPAPMPVTELQRLLREQGSDEARAEFAAAVVALAAAGGMATRQGQAVLHALPSGLQALAHNLGPANLASLTETLIHHGPSLPGLAFANITGAASALLNRAVQTTSLTAIGAEALLHGVVLLVRGAVSSLHRGDQLREHAVLEGAYNRCVQGERAEAEQGRNQGLVEAGRWNYQRLAPDGLPVDADRERLANEPGFRAGALRRTELDGSRIVRP